MVEYFRMFIDGKDKNLNLFFCWFSCSLDKHVYLKCSYLKCFKYFKNIELCKYYLTHEKHKKFQPDCLKFPLIKLQSMHFTPYNTLEEETTWRNALSWKNPTNTKQFTLLKTQPITKLWDFEAVWLLHCNSSNCCLLGTQRYLDTFLLLLLPWKG